MYPAMRGELPLRIPYSELTKTFRPKTQRKTIAGKDTTRSTITLLAVTLVNK